jgi:Zn-dependent protease with chaperone function
VIYAASGNLDLAQREVERSIRVQPENPDAHLLLARILSAQGNVAQSRREIAVAAAQHASPAALEDADSGNRRLERRALIWEVPIGMVLALGLGVLLLYAAGGALSAIDMRSLSGAATLHGETTASERLIHRLYLCALWFGTVFFYLSVPGMVVISLVTGLGLIYLMFAYMSQIPIKLVLLLLLLALGGTWAVLRSLFLRMQEPEDGLLLSEAEEPQLFEALREVSEVAGTRMVDRVYLELGAMAAVRESGGALQVLAGRGKRVLHLGFWTLFGLDQSELKAILAHEYGHFSHGETRLTPVIGRIQGTLVQMLSRMASLGRIVWLNPVYWYLHAYLRAFFTTTASHSRRKELLADRAAALAYGGDVFGRALRSVVEAGLVFDRYAGAVASLLRKSGRPCNEIYRALAAARAVEPPALQAERTRGALEHPPGKYDSHPPPADRIARVAGVSGQRTHEAAPALSLLSDPDATARVLAERIRTNVDQNLARDGIKIPDPVEMAPEAQAWFAEGLALHAAAAELEERKDPESDSFLIKAADRLGAALGDADPLLVPVLSGIARVHERNGRATDARIAANRGLQILASHPDAEARSQLQAVLTRLDSAA